MSLIDWRWLADALERGYAQIIDKRYNGDYDDYLGEDPYRSKRGRRETIDVTIRIDAQYVNYLQSSSVGGFREAYPSIEAKVNLAKVSVDLARPGAWFMGVEPDPEETAYKKFIKWQEWWANAYDRNIACFELHQAQWAGANDVAYNTRMARYLGYRQEWVIAEARMQDDIRNCFTALVTATKITVLAWADSIEEEYKRSSLLELK